MRCWSPTEIAEPRWDDVDWRALDNAGVRRQYVAGQPIIAQGDQGTWVAALIAGRTKILYSSPSGDEVLIGVRGPGDLLGEFSYADGAPRSASVRAVERCTASLVSRASFNLWLTRPRVRAQFDRYMVAKSRESAGLTWQLYRQRPTQRLAALILLIGVAARGEERELLSVPMSQDELARSIGLVRSSITPILATWKKQGVVTVGRSRLTVMRPEILERLRQGM